MILHLKAYLPGRWFGGWPQGRWGKSCGPNKYVDEGVSLKIIEICLMGFILLASVGGTALAEDGIKASESGTGSEISPAIESLSLEGSGP